MSLTHDESRKVFGLNYKEHDARKIRHILKHYEALPEDQGDRLSLFLRLQALENELHQDVCGKIENWLASGGDLPDRHPQIEATDPVIGTSEGADKGENASDEEIKGGETNEEANASDEESDGEETDEDTPFEWYTEQDMNRYLQRHPEFDLFDLIPLHPDNPERGAYTMGEEESSSEPDHNSEEDETDDEDDEDETDDEDDEDETDDEDDEEEEDTAQKFTCVKAQQSQSSALVECDICKEMIPKSNIYQRITRECYHPAKSYTCQQCLDSHISTTVEGGSLNKIRCPICPAVLTSRDMKKASKKVFERYVYLADRASRPSNFIECLGPNCDGGKVYEGPEPFMTCDDCSFKTCIRHRLPWHEGRSCDDFDMEDAQIDRWEQAEATAKILTWGSNICPNCNVCVTRSKGCDEILCVCGIAWCYLCGVEWEDIIRLGPTAHSRNCPNHPRPDVFDPDQIIARETKIAELVHGGPINERLDQARRTRAAARREEKRRLALAAKKQRMKDQATEDSTPDQTPPPRKRRKLTARREAR